MKSISLETLSARVCIVTGVTGGLGKAISLEMAKLGGSMVLACRNQVSGEAVQSEIEAATGNNAIELMVVDLSVQQSVREMAVRFKEKHNRLDVLVNNAAVFKNKRVVTPDGLETMFATNHLGPFLLTNLLLDELKAADGARVINVTAPSTTKLNFQDLQGEQKFNALTAFGA
jgi:NAD(P)-dependent dehydrogenase (short-subunit alcohol dehydrogenase family)